MEIKCNKINKNDISKIEFSFALENSKGDDNEYMTLIQYELIIEKLLKSEMRIILYEINDDLSIIQYSNVLALDYFIVNFPLLKCISTLSKVPHDIDNIFQFFKRRIELEIKNNSSNLIFNEKNMNMKIIKSSDDNDKIKLIFEIYLCNLKKEFITIELKRNEIYHNENNPLIINELISQNYNLINDIRMYEDELKKLTKEKNNYISIINKYNNYYGQSIKMKMNLMDKGIDTDIFTSKKDLEFIKYSISNIVNHDVREIRQIFKASTNGDNINAFLQNCTGVHNTLIIILSDNKKTFGGFTQAEWDGSNRYKYDENAFIFSIDNKEIYPVLNRYKKMAINCYDEEYMSVFGSDIYICDYFFSNNMSIAQEAFYDYSKSKIKGEYKLNGQKYFGVLELEIYQIVF